MATDNEQRKHRRTSDDESEEPSKRRKHHRRSSDDESEEPKRRKHRHHHRRHHRKHEKHEDERKDDDGEGKEDADMPVMNHVPVADDEMEEGEIVEEDGGFVEKKIADSDDESGEIKTVCFKSFYYSEVCT